MAYLTLNFTPTEDKVDGLAIYSKEFITSTDSGTTKGTLKTDIIKGQTKYKLPGIKNKYKFYIK